jgi:hypothetical protein
MVYRLTIPKTIDDVIYKAVMMKQDMVSALISAVRGKLVGTNGGYAQGEVLSYDRLRATR